MFMQVAYQYPAGMVIILLLLAVWEAVWKGIALWYSARHNHKRWFICLVIFNTVGILPIIYLLWFKPKEKNENIVRVESASKKNSGKKK